MLVHESLNGGVVQTRHPTLLRPGEVQKADEMILKPGDPRLHRAPGRTAYGTVRSTAISVTTNGTTLLTSVDGFGTDITGVTVTAGSPFLTKASAFGAIVEGMSIVNTGIPAGTVVRRVIDSSTVEMSKNATATGTHSVTFCDLHPGTFISGTGITTGTYIVSIADASNLTMSAAASDSTTASRTFSEAVTGLSALEFNTVENYLLLAKAADKLYTSGLTGLTGTFTALLVGLSQAADAILKTIRYNERHVLLTGYDTPRLLYYKNNAVATRTLGMIPVEDFIGASTVAGSWSSLETFQEGYYYFLVTEVFHPGEDDEVESSYVGDPKYTRITDYLTQGVQISYLSAGSSPANDGLNGHNRATHWRIYIAPKRTSALPVPDLSEFRAISDPVNPDSPMSIPFSLAADGTLSVDATFTLKDSNPFQTGWAKTLASYGSYATLFPNFGAVNDALSVAGKQTITAVFNTTAGTENILTSATLFGAVKPGMVITSPNNRVPYGTVVLSVAADNNTLIMSNKATSAGSESVGFGNRPSFDNNSETVPPNPSGNFRAGAFQDFGIQNVGGFSSGVITGIKVRIKVTYRTAGVSTGGDRGFYVYLNKGATEQGEKWVKLSGPFVGSGIYEVGGPGETWGLTWSPSDFVDGSANVNVLLRKHSAAVDIFHTIDGVEITVYAGGNTINLDGRPFKTIILSDQVGNSFGVPAALAPPIAAVGGVVQGQMILIDKTDLVASLPDNIDAYPDAYRLPLGDTGKAFQPYGRGAIVGCINSVKRLNYFPTERDADFSRGRAFEDIAVDHGIVGPEAITLLDLPGRGTVAPYLSYNGLHVTDGVTSSALNDDIDWVGASTGTPLIEPTLIDRSILQVYPKLYLLALYYVPYGGTRRTKVLYFSYHPTHVKEGLKLPAIGPCSCQGGSADAFILAGASHLATGHGTDGKVYIEDSGTTDENSVAVAPTVRTRRFYASMPGMEGRIERLFLIADAAGDATTGAFTATLYRQNQAEALTAAHVMPSGSEAAPNTLYGGLIELWPDDSVETFEMEFTKSTAQSAAFGMHYIFFHDSRSADDING